MNVILENDDIEDNWIQCKIYCTDLFSFWLVDDYRDEFKLNRPKHHDILAADDYRQGNLPALNKTAQGS